MKLVYCAGTGTDVGKTWVGAACLAELRRRGVAVAARKPVQSFDGGAGDPTDADVLAAATAERPHDVCPRERWYGVAMAPPMAAAVLGVACPTITELAAVDRPPVELLWVEGVGGPRSPVAADGDGVDLARALAPDIVVLVADAGLGTINAVRLCVDALSPAAAGVVVHLNRYDDGDDLHRRNRDWLVDGDGLTVTTAPDELVLKVGPHGGREAQPSVQPAAATPPPGGMIDFDSR